MGANKKEIEKLFHQKNGYVYTSDLRQAGIHHAYLEPLLKEGIIIKVKHGLYKLTNWEIEDELEEVVRIVPNGVVCLLSAWSYYELSNYVPPEYHVAIEKSQKVVLPDYPPIQLYFWTQKYWKLGITSVKIGNTEVKIYDKEKCVCDAIRYRNKLGKEVEKEVLENYLRFPGRNIDLLFSYAKELRVKTKLTQYLELLI